MSSRRLSLAAIALAALIFSACGGDSQKRGADITTPPTVATTTEATMHDMTTVAGATSTMAAGGQTYTIVAKNIAFDPKKLTIPVHQDVKIVFDNQDASVPHNVHFMTPKEAKTDTKNGPQKDTLTLNVDKAGTYKFLCDVHPTMTGELTVS